MGKHRNARSEMAEAALLFVHSPLVGPLSWRFVADELAAVGWSTVVAELSPALDGPGPYQPRIAAAVAQAANGIEQPLVLIGHSGAGPLLPAIAAAIGDRVRTLLYVDAGLPSPGKRWVDTAPPDLNAHLMGLAVHGRLPPWNDWFRPEALSELLPDASLRAAFIAELPSLPLEYFHETMPDVSWSGRAGYLLLSESYRDAASAAIAQKMPLREFPSHHLAMLTSPRAVATALSDLLEAVSPP